MKEIIRQYAGAVIAALVAAMLLLVIAGSAQQLKRAGSTVRLAGGDGVLTQTSASGAFDRCWRGR